jgi:hypothetical protein
MLQFHISQVRGPDGVIQNGVMECVMTRLPQLRELQDRYWNCDRLRRSVCRSLKSGAFAFLLAIGFAAAPAEAVQLYKDGAWQVDFNDVGGRPRCSITNDNYRHFLQIYYERGSDHLSLQVGSDDWDLPSDRTYAYRMQFDDGAEWNADATSGRYRDGGSYIDVDIIKTGQMRDWLNQFARSQNLIISFPGTGIRPWVLDLSGTRNVVDNFIQCLDDNTNS